MRIAPTRQQVGLSLGTLVGVVGGGLLAAVATFQVSMIRVRDHLAIGKCKMVSI